MKTKIWYYIQNLYDGSATVRFFKSKEDAEKYADIDDERFCDDIECCELEFDENGKLLNPTVFDC